MSDIKLIKNKILIGAVALGALAMPVATGVASVSGLTYQNSTDVSFTFNPVLSVSISDDLTIADLAPGTFADSNEIVVTVSTNNAYGYTLSATVGDTDNNLSDELRHSTYASTGDPIFSSIATDANLARATFSSDTTYDNKWGLATSNDGSTWGNYNGLPIAGGESAMELLSSSYTPTNGTASKYVRIGARASSTQSSGTYTNKINFVAVGGIAPMTLEASYAAANKTKQNGYYKMQDMNSSICNAVDVEDDQLQVIDTRDNKIYWIAKLKDGHCWMTQNLDLELETTPTNVATLTSANTDLNTYGSNGYDSDHGYVCSNAETDCNGGTITWTPANATTQLNADGKTFASLGDSSTDNNVPKSLNVGDWYYAGYDGTNLLASTEINYLTSTNRVTNNGVTTVNNGNGVDYFSDYPFTGTGTSNNGTHGHLGNYYNWSASVASNDTSSYASDTFYSISDNPQNSICPAGWRLPTITSASPTYSSVGSANEFARLVYLYNGNSYVTNSSAKLEKSPLFFVRGGYVSGSSLYGSGSSAGYWSSTVNSSSRAYYLTFSATYVTPATNYYRYYGFSVRCLAR